jgi:hypothetical protein
LNADLSGPEISIIFIRTNPSSKVFLVADNRNVKPPATAGGTGSVVSLLVLQGEF